MEDKAPHTLRLQPTLHAPRCVLGALCWYSTQQDLGMKVWQLMAKRTPARVANESASHKEGGRDPV